MEATENRSGINPNPTVLYEVRNRDKKAHDFVEIDGDSSVDNDKSNAEGRILMLLVFLSGLPLTCMAYKGIGGFWRQCE